jgi:hypothetical protein
MASAFCAASAGVPARALPLASRASLCSKRCHHELQLMSDAAGAIAASRIEKNKSKFRLGPGRKSMLIQIKGTAASRF